MALTLEQRAREVFPGAFSRGTWYAPLHPGGESILFSPVASARRGVFRVFSRDNQVAGSMEVAGDMVWVHTYSSGGPSYVLLLEYGGEVPFSRRGLSVTFRYPLALGPTRGEVPVVVLTYPSPQGGEGGLRAKVLWNLNPARPEEVEELLRIPREGLPPWWPTLTRAGVYRGVVSEKGG